MIWTGWETKSVGSFKLGLQDGQFGWFGLFLLVLTHPS